MLPNLLEIFSPGCYAWYGGNERGWQGNVTHMEESTWLTIETVREAFTTKKRFNYGILP